jgi:hypothetical protein
MKFLNLNPNSKWIIKYSTYRNAKRDAEGNIISRQQGEFLQYIVSGFKGYFMIFRLHLRACIQLPGFTSYVAPHVFFWAAISPGPVNDAF